MTPPLTIWFNAQLPPDAEAALQEGLNGHRLVLSPDRQHNLTVGRPDPTLQDADIAFGQPNIGAIAVSPGLRWIHLSSAGYTRYDTDSFRAACRQRNLMVTNSSAVYDEPCAQHCVAFLYAHARQLLWTTRDQLTARSWNSSPVRNACTLLDGQRVLVYGYGEIARRLIELLAPLGLDIIGVRRRPRGDEAVNTVALEAADRLLPEADIVINLLPANEGSDGYFNFARLASFKAGTVFVNIGRGTTVDQHGLLNALEHGSVAAAYLDVTEPEPLPTHHPLWTHPNVMVTPHTAGGSSDEHHRLVRHFLANFQRFRSDQGLINRVI